MLSGSTSAFSKYFDVELKFHEVFYAVLYFTIRYGAAGIEKLVDFG